MPCRTHSRSAGTLRARPLPPSPGLSTDAQRHGIAVGIGRWVLEPGDARLGIVRSDRWPLRLVFSDGWDEDYRFPNRENKATAHRRDLAVLSGSVHLHHRAEPYSPDAQLHDGTGHHAAVRAERQLTYGRMNGLWFPRHAKVLTTIACALSTNPVRITRVRPIAVFPVPASTGSAFINGRLSSSSLGAARNAAAASRWSSTIWPSRSGRIPTEIANAIRADFRQIRPRRRKAAAPLSKRPRGCPRILRRMSFRASLPTR